MTERFSERIEYNSTRKAYPVFRKLSCSVTPKVFRQCKNIGIPRRLYCSEAGPLATVPIDDKERKCFFFSTYSSSIQDPYKFTSFDLFLSLGRSEPAFDLSFPS